MKHLVGVLGFIAVLALYWIGGGEFERSPVMAYYCVVAVFVGGVAYTFWSW